MLLASLAWMPPLRHITTFHCLHPHVGYLICAAPTANGHGRNAWRVEVLCLIPNRYTALVAGGGAPVMNDLAAGMGACMKEHSPGAGIISTTMQTYSPMLVTESESVAPELTLMQRPPVA